MRIQPVFALQGLDAGGDGLWLPAVVLFSIEGGTTPSVIAGGVCGGFLTACNPRVQDAKRARTAGVDVTGGACLHNEVIAAAMHHR